MVQQLGFLNKKLLIVFRIFSPFEFAESQFCLYSCCMYLVHISNAVFQRKQFTDSQNTGHIPRTALSGVLIDILYLRGKNISLLPKHKCVLHATHKTVVLLSLQ